LQIIFNFHHIQNRYSLGNYNHQVKSRISGLHDRIGGKSRGHKYQAAIGSGVIDGIFNGIKYRYIIHFLTGFAGSNAGNNLGACGIALLYR
jgi:hypothetical protein